MERVQAWLATGARRGWQAGGVAVGVFVLWQLFGLLRLLVLTLAVALLLAALLVPVSAWLERRGWPRSVAALGAVGGGAVLILGILALLVWRLATQGSRLAQEFDTVRNRVTGWLTGTVGVSQDQISQGVDRAADALQGSLGTIASGAASVLAGIGALVTAVILAFFFVRDRRELTDWILLRLVTEDERPLARAALGRVHSTLQGYIRATVLIGGLDAILIGTALLLLGVPLAIPLAVLTFFGGFFPVVGATAAGALAALVALASGGAVQALVVVAVVLVVQQVDGNILQPVIMGRAVHLHPVVVLVALAAGGLLAGVLGAFLAVPLTAVGAAVGNEVRVWRGQESL